MFGIQLAVHASFFLLLAYAGFEGWQDGGGWLGSLVSVAIVVAFFICVVLHELGHSLTARRYGVQVPRILLMPIGGMAQFDRIPSRPRAEFLITLAGPAVNLAIVLLLWPLVGLPDGLPLHPTFEDSFRGLGQLLLYWNGVMGLFNLLPVFPMDGGRIFRATLATRLPYLQATWWAVMVGRVFAVALIGCALYLDRLMMAVLFTFILVVGNNEYQLVLRREQEAAYWREMARQAMASAPPPQNEPPLLIHGPN